MHARASIARLLPLIVAARAFRPPCVVRQAWTARSVGGCDHTREVGHSARMSSTVLRANAIDASHGGTEPRPVTGAADSEEVIEVDVAVIGGGLGGAWDRILSSINEHSPRRKRCDDSLIQHARLGIATAVALQRLDPSCRCLVFERDPSFDARSQGCVAHGHRARTRHEIRRCPISLCSVPLTNVSVRAMDLLGGVRVCMVRRFLRDNAM
jgi:hypothetical protein